MSPGHSSLPLTILLITFLLLPSSTAYCPEKYSYQVCHQLYHLFEQALLASPQNLYKIREEYFPSSRASPVYGHVGYNISYDYGTSFSYNATRPCDGNDVKSPLVPMKHSKCIPWSSSAILAYIDPMYLNSFQINLLDRLFQNVGAVAANLSDCANQYHQMSSMHVHLQLMLRLQEELPCIPSVEQASAVLEDLTSWVMQLTVLILLRLWSSTCLMWFALVTAKLQKIPFLFGSYVKLRITLIAKLLHSFCYKVEVTHGHIYYTRLKLTFNTVFCQCEVHLWVT